MTNLRAVFAVAIVTTTIAGVSLSAAGASFASNNVDVAASDVVTIPVADSPFDIAIDSDRHKGYVPTWNGVAVIDTLTNRVITTIPIPSASSPVIPVVNQNTGKAYFRSGEKVTVVDTNSDSVLSTIKIDQAGGFNINETLVVDSTHNRIYASVYTGLMVIDGETDTKMKVIKDDRIAHMIPEQTVVDDKSQTIYVTTGIYDDLVLAINPITEQITPIEWGKTAVHWPVSIAVDQESQKLYVGLSDGAIRVIDGLMHNVVKTISVSRDGYGADQQRLRSDPANRRILSTYVAFKSTEDGLESRKETTVIDADVDETTEIQPWPSLPTGVAVDAASRKIFAAFRWENCVMVTT